MSELREEMRLCAGYVLSFGVGRVLEVVVGLVSRLATRLVSVSICDWRGAVDLWRSSLVAMVFSGGVLRWSVW